MTTQGRGQFGQIDLSRIFFGFIYNLDLITFRVYITFKTELKLSTSSESHTELDKTNSRSSEWRKVSVFEQRAALNIQ